MSKQLEDLEQKLAQLDALDKSETRADSGLPVQDIYEELDADGNVISSRIGNPDEAEPQIRKALEKAGVRQKDLPKGGQSKSDVSTEANFETENAQNSSKPSSELEPDPRIRSDRDRKTSVTSKHVSSVDQNETGFKSTATATSPTYSPRNNADKAASSASSNSTSPKPASAHLQDVAKHSFPNGERVVEVDSDDEAVAETASRASLNESPEDARLRAQMLEYSMREVGEIVAQMDIDEDDDDEDKATDSGTAEFASDEDTDMINGDDAEQGWDLDETDDEDEHGLNRSSNMSEAYRDEMMELEKRLNARMFQNVGPNPNPGALEPAAQQTPIGGTVASPDHGPKTTTLPERPAKEKAVRFAESLDMAPESKSSKKTSSYPERTEKGEGDRDSSPAVRDNVIERAPPPQADNAAATPAKKMSRFRAARQQSAAEPPPAVQPHRSSANPLANNIIERPASGATQAPSMDDEFDPVIQEQQLKREYYDYRNRQVQREGGFARFGRQDEGEAEVSDEEEEERRKMSLFKKARAEGWGGGRRKDAM